MATTDNQTLRQSTAACIEGFCRALEESWASEDKLGAVLRIWEPTVQREPPLLQLPRIRLNLSARAHSEASL